MNPSESTWIILYTWKAYKWFIDAVSHWLNGAGFSECPGQAFLSLSIGNQIDLAYHEVKLCTKDNFWSKSIIDMYVKFLFCCLLMIGNIYS